eukprot:jgi/Mesvir1/20323/Mv19913-RA.1
MSCASATLISPLSSFGRPYRAGNKGLNLHSERRHTRKPCIAVPSLGARSVRAPRAQVSPEPGAGINVAPIYLAVVLPFTLLVRYAGEKLSKSREPPVVGKKLKNQPLETIAKILKQDIIERDYLVTGRLTREIYDENCTFADPTANFGPGLQRFLDGVDRLFYKPGCSLELVGDVKILDSKTIEARWKEVASFNVWLHPKTYYGGKSTLTLNDENLVVFHQETWDLSPLDIYKTAKF